MSEHKHTEDKCHSNKCTTPKAIPRPYWITVKGEFLKPTERRLLYQLAKRIADHFDKPNIINIGVSWGGSVHCLHAGAPEAYITAIDIDYQRRPVQEMDKLPESKVDFVVADSKYLKFDQLAHLVFVDGDHCYEGVKGDGDNWIPRIPIGGIVAFHDYSPQPRDIERLAGVKRAVDEWHEANTKSWLIIEQKLSVIAFQRVH